MQIRTPSLHSIFARPIPLNAYLTRLIIGVVGPLLLFAIFMMVLFARQEHFNRQRGLESAARSLALAVDQEIRSSITKLEAVATSVALDTGALTAFQAAVERLIKTQKNWQSVTLFSPRGAPLVVAPENVAILATVAPEDLAEVLQTRQPVVTDLSVREDRGGAVSIHVPVVRERRVAYILSAAIEPTVFTEILARQKLPEEWVGILFDSKRVTIARSRDAGKFIGRAVGSPLDRTDVLSAEQFLSGDTPEGKPAYAAVSRSQLGGWFMGLTVPRSELNAILYGSIGLVAGGGLLLLLSGLAVGLLFARRASDSIIKMAAAAHRLGQGESASFPQSTPIAELDVLAKEMTRAGRLLREREEERDRVESELRLQEENLQRQADLLNLANEAIFATRLDGRILYWNRGAERLYGYRPDEAVGALSHQLLSTEFPEGWSRFAAALNASGEWNGELSQKTRNGQRIDVESRFKLIHDRAGDPLVLECSRDVTQRKRAARRRAVEHQVTVALAESETPESARQKLLEILATGLQWDGAAFWVVRPRENTIECVCGWAEADAAFAGCGERPPLTRGAGLSGRVWQSETAIWIGDLSQEDRSLILSFADLPGLRSALAFPITMRGQVLGVVELLGRMPREPDRDMLRAVQAIGGEVGQFTERTRAEAALRESEEHLRTQAQQLEQQLLASGRLVAVGELTASMAHEFNNPLGIILGFAQGLLESMEPEDPNYSQVQIIADEAKRCEKLVQELLEFGRPKSADLVDTDVTEIIQRTMSLVQPHAAKNRVETELQIDDGLPRLCADPQQLQQVLLNLSLNAVDAMPKGGRLALKAARRSDAEISIVVEDTGIGIDADLLPKIFQPFITSKKRRGLGLGLPICDRIVKAHGGRITVSSQPGQGTTFTVHLPLLPPNASAHAPQPTAAAL